MKKIRNLLIGLLFLVGISSCSTLEPPPPGPGVVYYSYPTYFYGSYYRYNYLPKYYRPTPPPPKPHPNTPPPRPNNGNRRHR